MMDQNLLILVLGLLLAPATAAQESVGQGQSAAFSRDKILPLVKNPGKSKKVFSSFKKGEKAAWNKDFWGAPLGFETYTGMGWHHPQVGVLVTPEHIVGAAHYGVWPHGVDFYGSDGTFLGNRKPARRENGKVASIRFPPDVLVIRLESPAPEGARICRLPDPKGHEQRLAWSRLPADARPLLVATDFRNPRAKPPTEEAGKKKQSPWKITRTAHPVLLRTMVAPEKSMQWDHGRSGDEAIHPSYRETVNKGDSSNPIFWVSESGLVLASTFTGVFSGPDYGHPELQKELQAAIDKLGGAKPYRLQFAPVP